MSDLKRVLIGKEFPVKDTDGNFVKSVPIVWAKHCENISGMVVALSADPHAGVIFLTYPQATELLQ